jgi:ABC-type transport system involved in cytochrome c biogenesis permease subunit
MKIKIFFFLTLIFSFSIGIFAQENAVKHYETFKRIPVLADGRLKPMDTYARNVLIQFSGKDTYERQGAVIWLAKLLFTPDAVKDDKVFLINNPEIATALNIPVDPHRRYTPAQLQKSYQKLAKLAQAAKSIPEKERSIVENEIGRVYDNIIFYAGLSRCMIFAYPSSEFTIISAKTKAKLELPAEQKQFSFVDIALKADVIGQITKGLENKSQFSADEAELMKVVQNLFQWSNIYRDIPIALIPSSQSERGWISTWEAINTEFSNPKIRELITYWRNMTVSFVQGNDVEFNVAAHLYGNAVINSLTPEDSKRLNKFSLELLYHSSSPFLWAKIFYIFAFIFFVISFGSSNALWYRLGLGAVFLGFIPHMLGLIARIIIMARPPVSNLYETFIFVGFITVLLGLLIEHFNRQWLGIVTAAISGTALLFIAGKYSAEGDTLKMLIAVLNSNFWLATHVTTITMGYGATCVAGILGHIWLIQAAIGKDSKVLDKTHRTILGILGLALPLTFLGTNLGGIWADQSWGRFWGWDPKENGALMIVIWITIILHARVANLIGTRGLAMGAVLGMVVVMWAWFGVNLLSVGLHSYGFTSGAATSLAIYIACEIIFLGVTAWFIHRNSSPLKS